MKTKKGFKSRVIIVLGEARTPKIVEKIISAGITKNERIAGMLVIVFMIVMFMSALLVFWKSTYPSKYAQLKNKMANDYIFQNYEGAVDAQNPKYLEE